MNSDGNPSSSDNLDASQVPGADQPTLPPSHSNSEQPTLPPNRRESTPRSDSEQPTLPPRSDDGQATRPDQITGFDETIAPLSRDPKTVSKSSDKKGIKQFGDYELTEEIARGGMGVVYRGTQKSLNRDVAVKMILAGQFASQDEVDRFYTEAKAAATLDHRGIVPVYEFGEHDGHHFFSMKLIEGSDLARRMSELRNDLPKAVNILRVVCNAVHHAHERCVLHRDLKPGNILLDEADQPFVTDLGLARTVGGDSKLTRTGAVIGTPSYMPPEQASGSSDITTAADIYSLGAILYEMLTGRPPFQGSSPVQTLMQVINELPERPSMTGAVDRDLESICLKCLAKEPSDRYSSAASLARDLQSWLSGDPISVRASSLTNVTRFWLKQNFGSAIWAFVIGPIAGVVSGLSLWYSTIGTDRAGLIDVYEKLPSAEIPFSLSLRSLPAWTQFPLLILFVMSIVLIGYVTVRFVNPKNRGADIASGAIVGLFATLAAFFVGLGPTCLLTSLDYSDMRLVMQLVEHKADETPGWLAERYPELNGLERSEQVNTLMAKLETDHFLQVPQGLLIGIFVSTALYFFPCLLETIVAGPIIRRDKRWFVSFPAYMEITFPVVTLMTILALAITTWLVFGGCGIRWTIRLALVLTLVTLAIIAIRQKWHLVPRVVAQMCLVAAFVWFFSVDFNGIPAVSHGNGIVTAAKREIRESPNSFDARAKLIRCRMTFANILISENRASEAETMLNATIEKADVLAKEAELDNYNDLKMRRIQCQCRLQKVGLYINLNKLDEAQTLWEATRDEFPGFPATGAVYLQLKSKRESQ